MDEGGRLDDAALCGTVAALGDGLPAGGAAELGCHPGLAADPERRRYRWGYHWPEELAALRSPAVREAVDRASLRLGSFADLAPHNGFADRVPSNRRRIDAPVGAEPPTTEA